ncbi:MAG: chorismate synthase [Bacteroidales bacterium]|nr:chorismate synthase [Bacteroidales bacterium]
MNTIGRLFRLTTFGESHGTAIGGILDGCPAGLQVDCEQVQLELRRRSEGESLSYNGQPLQLGTPRREEDEVEWLSGILDGETIGSPIAFMVRNRDARSADYSPLQHTLRAGHADYTWLQKYGLRDWRSGGRASARETAARVVAGAIAKQWLGLRQIHIQACTATIGSYPITSPLSETTFKALQQHIEAQSSLGGTVRCTIDNLPPGVGEPLFDKLSARLAAAVMSIPSTSAFAIGDGFEASKMCRQEYVDNWAASAQPEAHSTRFPPRLSTTTNHCGGIQGGLSNGMPITFTVGFHPICSARQGMTGFDLSTHNTEVIDLPSARFDLCQVPRAVVIVEAMAALTVADLMMEALAHTSLNPHAVFHQSL